MEFSRECHRRDEIHFEATNGTFHVVETCRCLEEISTHTLNSHVDVGLLRQDRGLINNQREQASYYLACHHERVGSTWSFL